MFRDVSNVIPGDRPLPDENSHIVPDEWFDHRIRADQYLSEEVEALKAYHDKCLTGGEAAYAITRRVTDGTALDDGTMLANDQCFALMSLLASALDKWPLTRTGDLITLLQAFRRLEDGPNKSLIFSDHSLEWKHLPYFSSIWCNDYCQERPGYIAERYHQSPTRRSYEMAIYLKRQDVWAQLTAAGFTPIKDAYFIVIWALEQKAELNDSLDPSEKIIPELHIPAAARWIHALGKRFYQDAVEEKLQDGYRVSRFPNMVLNYDHMCKDRWAFWEKRFTEFANGAGGEDELTKKEAKAAVEHMQAVVKAWEMENESIAG
ncbi:hypothetical protein D6D03_00257 [Aureobasidium pullulans]|nr:hypothetical protein D6D03_00257 [Aureobasidium pullulans]